MIPVRGLFETHLTVSDLERSIAFYGVALGLDLAHRDADREVAFYWMGGARRCWACGRWGLRPSG